MELLVATVELLVDVDGEEGDAAVRGFLDKGENAPKCSGGPDEESTRLEPELDVCLVRAMFFVLGEA